MADVRAVWRSRWFDLLGAGVYDFVVERERLAQVLGRLVWGTDASRLYRRMSTVARMPDGSAILDVPCGGGVAFRALKPAQRVSYVAVDLSPGMLHRARREAQRRGLEQIEFLEADVESLPFEDARFDLCLCFNSLHCFPDPAAALREIARCLRPDGRFVGDSAFRGAGARFDRLIDLYSRRGVFGRVGTLGELERWFREAGMQDPEIETSGAVAHLSAKRAAIPTP
jgi:ubiquinone/menaquinone biosynthesis C-methylase UbiE